MFCTRCGHELKDGMRFCTSCGAPVPGGSDDATVEASPGNGGGAPHESDETCAPNLDEEVASDAEETVDTGDAGATEDASDAEETVDIDAVNAMVDAGAAEETVDIGDAGATVDASGADETMDADDANAMVDADDANAMVDADNAEETVDASDTGETVDIGAANAVMDASDADETMDVGAVNAMVDADKAGETVDIGDAGATMDAFDAGATVNIGAAPVAETAAMPFVGTDGQEAGDTASAAEKTKARPAGKRRLIIGAAAIVLIALAALAAVVAFGGLGSGVATVAFGSDDAISVTRTARIVPMADDGTPLEHYVVRVLSATDEDGEEIDLSGEPQSVEVSGTGGFTMENIVPNQDSGTYVIEIDDGTTVQTTPPIEIDEENGISDEVHIEQPTSSDTSADDADDADDTDDADDADADDAVRGADALFLEKLEELQDEYGEPSLEVTEDTVNVYYATVYGLAYAELIDFGDGEERLVVVWNERSDADGDSVATYNGTIEVWEYDEDADELVALLNGGDGIAFYGSSFDYYNSADGKQLLRVTISESSDDGSYTGFTYNYYGLDESGAFGVYFSGRYENDGSAETLYINGEAVSSEEFYDAIAELLGDSAYLGYKIAYISFQSSERDAALNGYSEFTVDALYPAATVETVPDMIALLEERISAAEDDTATGDDDIRAAAVTDATAEEVTETIDLPTYDNPDDLSSSSGETSYAWGYLALSSDDADDAVIDRLNAQLKAEYDAELNDTEDKAASPTVGDEVCLSYRSALTYAEDGIVGVQIQQWLTIWGGRPYDEVYGMIYDLSTGEELEAWEFAGLSEDELDAAAVDAITAFVSADDLGRYYDDESAIRADAEALVASGSCTYLVTQEGVVIWLPTYSMKASYADGSMEIVVVANDGYESAVGTDVSDEYALAIRS